MLHDILPALNAHILTHYLLESSRPQVSHIVALGRAKWVWDVDRGDGKGERRLKIGVSWSGDHRVVEGAELAAFVECWRGYVEVPERLVGEGV